MDTRLLKPDRKGTYASLGIGVVFGAIGAAMVAGGNDVGAVVLLLAAVGLYGGIGGLVPGQGLLLDQQGFRLKSFGKSWGAQWLETESFEPKRVRVGRKSGDVAVVEIHYQQGLGDAHRPQHLLGRIVGIDERYLIAAYGGLSNAELAELLAQYRAANI
jgi:hypothetical protein